MNPNDIFHRYIQDRRQQQIAQFNREPFAHLVRYTANNSNAEGLVAYARLQPEDAVRQIREQVDYFRSIQQNFEWKVYAFDRPHNLRALLAAESFVADVQEAFMVFPLRAQSHQILARQGAWEVQRITSDAGVRDAVAVQERVWGRSFEWLHAQLLATRLRNPEQLSIYCAYAEGESVGSGWIEFPANSRFSELHGGAVLENWRGQGIYSNLFTVRLQEAKQRGYDFLCVDASPMSRPILEHIGFQFICSTVPMRKQFADRLK